MPAIHELAPSEYIEQERRNYSLYVLSSRAIPHAADGLKSAARRVLWMARDGNKYKSASLAGKTMSIHPHAAPEDAINTIAGPFKNNIPLLDGIGAFGTRLLPNAFGASRYTSVKISEFTKDVLFRDIEIIPMVENYDGSEMEPKHFLPLVPIVLLNPSEGIAVGFATNILPHDLSDIIRSQIQYLEGKKFKEPSPKFVPFNSRGEDKKPTSDGRSKWLFRGSIEVINTTTIRITELPYGLSHDKFLDKLYKLEEVGDVVTIEDNSRDHYDIVVKFKRGKIKNLTEEEICSYIGLEAWITENLTVIDFDGTSVWQTNYREIIEKFSEWRLTWYQVRYERLARLLEEKIQRYQDVITAIKKDVGKVAKRVESRNELKEFLTEIGIVHTNYICDLPVYRFTTQERKKVEEKLKEARALLEQYKKLISDPNARRLKYIEELSDILTKYKKGKYSTDQ